MERNVAKNILLTSLVVSVVSYAEGQKQIQFQNLRDMEIINIT